LFSRFSIYVTSGVALQWTPLGFKMTDPKTFDDISKERFQGTVLKTISRTPQIYQISKDCVTVEPEEKVGGFSRWSSSPPAPPGGCGCVWYDFSLVF